MTEPERGFEPFEELVGERWVPDIDEPLTAEGEDPNLMDDHAAFFAAAAKLGIPIVAVPLDEDGSELE
ncbi:MAG: hypothetical protein ACRDZ7_07005 [Acidimicrobiia bacterium]